MTNQQKLIYNTYLITSRKYQDKPARPRKDFTGFEDTENYVPIKKLDMFFTKYKHVDINDFFQAPYELFPDTTYYDLNFFTSRRALKTYTLYQTKKENELPDTDNQLFFIQSSLNYIFKYCTSNDIKSIDEYFNTKDGNIHIVLQHLKDRNVSIYMFFAKRSYETIFKEYEPSILSFMLGNIFEKLDLYRTRYYNSITAKKLIDAGLQKINKLLENN